MRPDPAITAALDGAARAECIARANVNDCAPVACTPVCRWCASGSAAAVAAFLRALPPITRCGDDFALYSGDAAVLAAAVEAAAKEAGDG